MFHEIIDDAACVYIHLSNHKSIEREKSVLSSQQSLSMKPPSQVASCQNSQNQNYFNYSAFQFIDSMEDKKERKKIVQ